MAQAQVQRKQQARDWPFAVKPLHPALGCEITGITLAQAVEPTMFGKVYEAFLDYELILFRDVDLPPATQVAFARSFGEIQHGLLDPRLWERPGRMAGRRRPGRPVDDQAGSAHSSLSRRGEMDRAGGRLAEPADLGGSVVAQHRARPGVQDGRPEPGLSGDRAGERRVDARV